MGQRVKKEGCRLLECRQFHEWPKTKSEATATQREMVDKVELYGGLDNVRTIAAVDTSYGHGGETLYACAVVTTFPEIEEIERTFHHGAVSFPYIPGLFYFREGPVIIQALKKVRSDVDLIIVHGHGVAHPQRCGMASQIGLIFDKPTIGCARKLLTGQFRPVAPEKGSFQPVTIEAREVAIAYRSKSDVKPIFISPGHKCDINDARSIVVQNLRGYRLPEPLRLAHLFANKYKRHTEKKREYQQN